MERIICDTSFFTNPASYKKYGKTSTIAVINFIKKYQKKFEIYITPSCYDELKNFVELKEIKEEILHKLHVKAPDRDSIQVSGAFVYEIIEQFRTRGDNSLQYSTSLIREIIKTESIFTDKSIFTEREMNEKYIKRLRDGHRHHMRNRFIDSAADLDTILLTKELRGRLITVDEGMKMWGNRLGVEIFENF